MNQLNKLIEQYPGDKHWVKVAIKNLTGSVWEFDKELVKFLEFLATRPTCGQEQRKFLDEIEKCYRGDLATESIALGKYSCIIDKDIVADLHKVTKGE